jgi:hypothetical protein
MRCAVGAGHAGISGVEKPIAHPATKRLLHETERTVAVDTESHLAARVAAARRIPFVAARVVLDPRTARCRRPLLPLCSDGSPDLPAIARSVRAAPGQVRTLAQLAVEASRARSALLLARTRLGEALAFETCQAHRRIRRRSFRCPTPSSRFNPPSLALRALDWRAEARCGISSGPGTRWRANWFFI